MSRAGLALSEADVRSRRARGASWVLVLGVMDFSLEQSILIPALPAMGRRYHAGVTAVTWTLTAFLVASAVATPLAGRLGDRYGRRRLLLASLATFGVGSLICALAWSIGGVIVGRVVQGVGAGVGPLAFALVPDIVPAEDVSRALGLLIGAGGLGAVVGLLAAGPLVDHVSVSSIFWLLFLVAAALAVMVVRSVPESPVRSRAAVDWPGAAVLSGFLAALTMAVSQGNDWGWRSPTILALFAASAVLLLLFVVRERTAREPLLDPRSLSRPAVVGANVAVFVIGVALFGAYILVPYIGGLPKSTGYGLGLTTTRIGLLLTPGSVAALFGGVIGGRLIERFGAQRQAIAGILCTVVAYLGFTLLPRTVPLLSADLVPLGFGIGLALVGIVELILVSVRPDETAAAVGVNSVLRAIGAAIGSSAASAILVAVPHRVPGVPTSGAFSDAFVVGLAGSVFAVCIMVLLPRRRADPILTLGSPA
jgi:MFS family permease